MDVRVVAATNRRPEEAVAEGKLREDLLYRLNVFPIHLPPLRERARGRRAPGRALPGRAEQGARTPRKDFTRPALERLRSHTWPGNVRELKNVVHRAFILADEDIGLDAPAPGRAGEPRARA